MFNIIRPRALQIGRNLEWIRFLSSSCASCSHNHPTARPRIPFTISQSGYVRHLEDLSRHFATFPENEMGNPDLPVDPDDPEGAKAIYKGILATQIKLVKCFSLMTSCIGLAFQPVLYLQAQSGQNMGVILAAGGFFSFFTFATPLIIHSISKKYVTEMYYNKLEDSYTAITYSLLLRKKQIKFRLQDVNVPDIPGMFTTFKAKNIPLFVDGQQFSNPKHFGKIMGYDKPLNLRWNKDKEEK